MSRNHFINRKVSEARTAFMRNADGVYNRCIKGELTRLQTYNLIKFQEEVELHLQHTLDKARAEAEREWETMYPDPMADFADDHRDCPTFKMGGR